MISRRCVTRASVLFAIIAFLILVFVYAQPGSGWYFFPFSVGPLLGGIILASYLFELRWLALYMLPKRKPGILVAFFTIILSYVGLVFIFSISYAGAINLDGQVLCAREDYVCLSHLDFGVFRQFGVLFYYSLVTASTLGYGDWVPRGTTTTLLVFLEVIAFWTLVLVSFTYFQETIQKFKRWGQEQRVGPVVPQYDIS